MQKYDFIILLLIAVTFTFGFSHASTYCSPLPNEFYNVYDCAIENQAECNAKDHCTWSSYTGEEGGICGVGCGTAYEKEDCDADDDCVYDGSSSRCIDKDCAGLEFEDCKGSDICRWVSGYCYGEYDPCQSQTDVAECARSYVSTYGVMENMAFSCGLYPVNDEASQCYDKSENECSGDCSWDSDQEICYYSGPVECEWWMGPIYGGPDSAIDPDLDGYDAFSSKNFPHFLYGPISPYGWPEELDDSNDPDCDERFFDDPDVCWTLNGEVLEKTGYNYVEKIAANNVIDCSNEKYSVCSQCKNPGAEEVCDGVDNDCNGICTYSRSEYQSYLDNDVFGNDAVVNMIKNNAYSDCTTDNDCDIDLGEDVIDGNCKKIDEGFDEDLDGHTTCEGDHNDDPLDDPDICWDVELYEGGPEAQRTKEDYMIIKDILDSSDKLYHSICSINVNPGEREVCNGIDDDGKGHCEGGSGLKECTVEGWDGTGIGGYSSDCTNLSTYGPKGAENGKGFCQMVDDNVRNDNLGNIVYDNIYNRRYIGGLSQCVLSGEYVTETGSQTKTVDLNSEISVSVSSDKILWQYNPANGNDNAECYKKRIWETGDIGFKLPPYDPSSVYGLLEESEEWETFDCKGEGGTYQIPDTCRFKTYEILDNCFSEEESVKKYNPDGANEAGFFDAFVKDGVSNNARYYPSIYALKKIDWNVGTNKKDKCTDGLDNDGPEDLGSGEFISTIGVDMFDKARQEGSMTVSFGCCKNNDGDFMWFPEQLCKKSDEGLLVEDSKCSGDKPEDKTIELKTSAFRRLFDVDDPDCHITKTQANEPGYCLDADGDNFCGCKRRSDVSDNSKFSMCDESVMKISGYESDGTPIGFIKSQLFPDCDDDLSDDRTTGAGGYDFIAPNGDRHPFTIPLDSTDSVQVEPITADKVHPFQSRGFIENMKDDAYAVASVCRNGNKYENAKYLDLNCNLNHDDRETAGGYNLKSLTSGGKSPYDYSRVTGAENFAPGAENSDAFCNVGSDSMWEVFKQKEAPGLARNAAFVAVIGGGTVAALALFPPAAAPYIAFVSAAGTGAMAAYHGTQCIRMFYGEKEVIDDFLKLGDVETVTECSEALSWTGAFMLSSAATLKTMPKSGLKIKGYSVLGSRTVGRLSYWARLKTGLQFKSIQQMQNDPMVDSVRIEPGKGTSVKGWVKYKPGYTPKTPALQRGWVIYEGNPHQFAVGRVPGRGFMFKLTPLEGATGELASAQLSTMSGSTGYVGGWNFGPVVHGISNYPVPASLMNSMGSSVVLSNAPSMGPHVTCSKQIASLPALSNNLGGLGVTSAGDLVPMGEAGVALRGGTFKGGYHGRTVASCLAQDCPPQLPKGGCFLAGTPILLSNGSYMNIEDINEGEKVLAYDLENNKTVPVNVTKTFEREAEEYLIINYTYAS